MRAFLLLLILGLGAVGVRAGDRPVLAYTLDLFVGSDVYFRVHDWHAHPEDVVAVLAQEYGANTLYILYTGQTDAKGAVAAFERWQAAATPWEVEIIPVLSKVNSYLGVMQPDWIVGSIDKSGLGPMVDIANPQVLAWYQDLAQQIDEALQPKTMGVFEFNDYSIAVFSETYPRYSSAQLEAWWKEILSATRAQPALTFQQPWGVNLRWLRGMTRVSVDTYGFLWKEEWEELRSYMARNVANYPEVDGDLVILDDYGGRIEGARQWQAAQIFRQVGVTGLNLDLIITAAVARDQRGEDFWLDLLSNGRYQGYYAEGLDAVAEIYQWWKEGGVCQAPDSGSGP